MPFLRRTGLLPQHLCVCVCVRVCVYGGGEGGERVLPPVCGACHQSVESFELRQGVARVTPSANTRSFAVASDGVFSPQIIGTEELSSCPQHSPQREGDESLQRLLRCPYCSLTIQTKGSALWDLDAELGWPGRLSVRILGFSSRRDFKLMISGS